MGGARSAIVRRSRMNWHGIDLSLVVFDAIMRERSATRAAAANSTWHSVASRHGRAFR